LLVYEQGLAIEFVITKVPGMAGPLRPRHALADLTDDVGTEYSPGQSSWSTSDDSARGRFEYSPAPPPTAERLSWRLDDVLVDLRLT
jgi:hypothetical protein